MIKSYLFFLLLFIGLVILYKYSGIISQFRYIENVIKICVLIFGIFIIIFPHFKTTCPKSFTKKNIKKYMLNKYKIPN